MRGDGAIAGDLVKGAIAGAAATWLMGQVTGWMYEHEGPEARQREDEARGDRTAYETAAEKAAGIAQVELSKEQRGQAGLAIHWATGIGAGIVYALLRRRAPAVASATGSPSAPGSIWSSTNY